MSSLKFKERAETLVRSGNFTEAMKVCNKWLESDLPQDPIFKLGEHFHKIGLNMEAIDCFSYLLDSQPNNEHYLAERSKCYRKIGFPLYAAFDSRLASEMTKNRENRGGFAFYTELLACFYEMDAVRRNEQIVAMVDKFIEQCPYPQNMINRMLFEQIYARQEFWIGLNKETYSSAYMEHQKSLKVNNAVNRLIL